jgi:hypothetical protein
VITTTPTIANCHSDQHHRQRPPHSSVARLAAQSKPVGTKVVDQLFASDEIRTQSMVKIVGAAVGTVRATRDNITGGMSRTSSATRLGSDYGPGPVPGTFEPAPAGRDIK